MIKTIEQKKQYRREQYLKHREKEQKNHAEYYQKNKDKINEKIKNYNKENPGGGKKCYFKKCIWNYIRSI